jgi:hypothetical protein
LSLLVASSTASDSIKKQADYVCDGTDDQVEIQAAIDALFATTVGGKVKLSAGPFYVSKQTGTTYTIRLKPKVCLQGEGMGGTDSDSNPYGTLIYLANTQNCNVIEYADDETMGATSIPTFMKLSEFTVNGNKLNQTTGHGLYFHSNRPGGTVADVLLDHVWAFNCKNDGIRIIAVTPQSVTSITGASKTLVLPGDVTGWFTVSTQVELRGSVTNTPGYFTIGGAGSITYDSGPNTTSIVVTNTMSNETTTGMTLCPRTRNGAWGILMRNCLSETNSGYGMYGELTQGYINSFYTAYNSLDQLRLQASQRVTVAQVQTLDATNAGLNAFAAVESSQINLTNCVFNSTSAYSGSPARYGIYLEYTGNSCFSGNIISKSSSGYWTAGLYHSSASGYNTFLGNTIYAAATGVIVNSWDGYGANPIHENTSAITGNVFASCTAIASGSARGIGELEKDIIVDMPAADSDYYVTTVALPASNNYLSLAATSVTVPRNISATLDGAATGSLKVIGVDSQGHTRTETVTLVSGGVAYSNYAYFSITSIQTRSISGAPNIIVGTSDKLGLTRKLISATGVLVFLVDTVNTVIPTVNLTYNTLDVSGSSPDGGKDFAVWYSTPGTNVVP